MMNKKMKPTLVIVTSIGLGVVSIASPHAMDAARDMKNKFFDKINKKTKQKEGEDREKKYIKEQNSLEKDILNRIYLYEKNYGPIETEEHWSRILSDLTYNQYKMLSKPQNEKLANNANFINIINKYLSSGAFHN